MSKIFTSILVVIIASAIYGALFMAVWIGFATAFGLPIVPFYAWWALGGIITCLCNRVHDTDE